MAKISVIGSGSWGTAVAIMLAQNGHEVMLWSYLTEESEELKENRENRRFLPGVKIPDTVRFTNQMKDCADAQLVIVAVPSHAMRQTAKNLAGVLKPKQLVLNISKGLEEESLCTMSQVLKQELPLCEIAVMSGPSRGSLAQDSDHQCSGRRFGGGCQFDSGYDDEPGFQGVHQSRCAGCGARRGSEKCHCTVCRDSGRNGAWR